MATQTIPDDYSLMEMDLQRRQKMADMLRTQASAPGQATEMVSGRAVKQPAGMQLVKMLQMLAANKMQDRNMEAQKELSSKYQAGEQAALINGLMAMKGTSGRAMPVNPEPTDPTDVAIAPSGPNLEGAMAAFGTHPGTKPYAQALMARILANPESSFSKIDPQHFTPASILKFSQTRNHSDLVPRDKLVRDDLGGTSVLRTEYSPDPISTIAKTASADTVMREVGDDRRFAGVSGNTAFNQLNENKRFAGVSGNTRATQAGENARFAGVSGNALLGVNPDIQRDLSRVKAAGAALGDAQVAPEVSAIHKKMAAEQQLKTIAFDPKTGADNVSELINQSTGSTAGALTDMAAGSIGISTEGAKAIAKLETIGNKIAMDANDGKLGSGISNADVLFIQGQFGKIASPWTPAETRAAAWQAVKDRILEASGRPTMSKSTRSTQGSIGGNTVIRFDSNGNQIP